MKSYEKSQIMKTLIEFSSWINLWVWRLRTDKVVENFEVMKNYRVMEFVRQAPMHPCAEDTMTRKTNLNHSIIK